MSTKQSMAARPSLGPYGRLARDYAVVGVPTFPVCPTSKKPLVSHYAGRTPNFETIETWARRYPHANLGFATRRAGVVVLDADNQAALAYFAQQAAPPILRTLTPKGQHWWFADPGSRRRGGNRPTDLAFDIKGAKACDFVILPGSISPSGSYQLADGDQKDLPGLFAERLRRLRPLEDAAYAALLGPGRINGPRTTVQPAPQMAMLTGMIATIGLDRIPEGRRNKAVFTFARRQCRLVRREVPDTQGEAVLLARVSHYNQIACDPPLDEAEVDKAALSAWRWDLANMQRLPANEFREIRRALVGHPGQARAVALLLLLTQTTSAGEDLVLAPARLAASDTIPNWNQGDFRSAIAALVASGRLRTVERPRRGRANAGVYRLAAPVATVLNVQLLLGRLAGDADAVVLYGSVCEQWGAPAIAGLSIRAMCGQRGGPFGTWDERRLRRARDHLEQAGLLQRHAQPRLGSKTPRAMFSVRSLDVPDVPKILEIAPEDSHRPRRPKAGRAIVPILVPGDSERHGHDLKRPRMTSP